MGRSAISAIVAAGSLWLLAACVSPVPGPPPAEAPAHTPDKLDEPGDPWAEPLREASGCRTLAARALAEGGAPPGLALRLVGDAAGIENDLGLPAQADAAGAGCVLIVEAPRPLPAAQRRLLRRETVRSSYADGMERAANPEHAELRKALARAENSRGSDTNLLTTGEPMVDLIGNVAQLVMAGVDKAVRMSEEAALRQRLAETPAEIDRPYLRRYSYETAELEASRGAMARAGLLDSGAGALRESSVQVVETTVFRVDEGRRDTDVGRSDEAPASVDLAALAAWERSPPPLRVSTLLERLQQAGTDRRERADDLLARWAATSDARPANVATVPRVAASLVEVAGNAGEGVGFHVGDERVLTLYRLVRGSDIARVTGADGRTAFAMVERRDRNRGLALLRVPAASVPLDIDGGQPSGPEAVLAWPGGPAEGARGRLARDDGAGGLLWQPDDPVRPPDGTPVLAGERVMAMVAETRELGATLLPAADIRAFLAAGP
ncbi:MAG TPA: hypothetical protein PKA13_00925 [Geminicoccaceae bacterium]|nr:hypothetical protein [Geminicoccus sp.]HMU48301.1 hypothetical protein [Geminicoccaceae bacterium]